MRRYLFPVRMRRVGETVVLRNSPRQTPLGLLLPSACIASSSFSSSSADCADHRPPSPSPAAVCSLRVPSQRQAVESEAALNPTHLFPAAAECCYVRCCTARQHSPCNWEKGVLTRRRSTTCADALTETIRHTQLQRWTPSPRRTRTRRALPRRRATAAESTTAVRPHRPIPRPLSVAL